MSPHVPSANQQENRAEPAARIAGFLAAHPLAALGVLLGIIGASAAVLPNLVIGNGLTPYLDKGSTQQRRLDRVNGHFTNDETLFIAYQTDDPFSHERLTELRGLCRRMRQIKIDGSAPRHGFIERLTSLSTIKDLEGSEMSFRTVPLVPDPVPRDPGRLARIKRRALGNPLIKPLVSNNHRLAMLLVRLRPELDEAQTARFIGKLRALLEQEQRRVPQTRYFLTGEPAVNADSARYQTEDLARFVPVVLIIITALLLVFVRRWRSLAIALAAVMISSAAAMAALVLVGSTLNNTSSMLPPVIIALTIAMLLHYFSELAKIERRGTPSQDAATTLRRLLPPALMAAATTSIGFLSLGVSNVQPVREFGIAAGVSIILAFIITTLCFNWAACRFPADLLIAPRSIGRSRRLTRLLTRLAGWITLRRRWILGGTLLVLALSGWGITRIVADMRDIDLFRPSAPVRQADEVVNRHFGGSTLFIVSIRAGGEDHFTSPQVLRKIAGLETFLRTNLGAAVVTSPVEHVKLMNREFNNGAQRAHRLPENQQQVAQLLLLNGDETLREHLDEGNRWARVVARMPSLSSSAVASRFTRLDRFLQQEFPASRGYEAFATGHSRLVAEMVLQLIRSQSRSLTLSGALILLLILVIFRSFKVGALALLPNTFPVVLNLGLMGWLGIRLDAATVMISSVAIGIAVDDTIHFLQHYQRGVSDHGDPRRGVEDAMQVKGPAIIWTSLVIGLGFTVLIFSRFLPTGQFGALTATAMFTALLGDLVILPALILCTSRSVAVRSTPRHLARAATAERST